MTKMQDDALDRLLAEAALNPPPPSPALMERVLADAVALQPVPPPMTRPAGPNPQPGLFARFAGLFGGLPGLTAVSAAAVLGIAVGYLNPASLDSLAGGLGDSATEEFFPAVDFLTVEG